VDVPNTLIQTNLNQLVELRGGIVKGSTLDVRVLKLLEAKAEPAIFAGSWAAPCIVRSAT